MHYWNFRSSEKSQKIWSSENETFDQVKMKLSIKWKWNFRSSENETFDQVKNDNFDQVKFDQLTPCLHKIQHRIINLKYYEIIAETDFWKKKVESWLKIFTSISDEFVKADPPRPPTPDPILSLVCLYLKYHCIFELLYQ